MKFRRSEVSVFALASIFVHLHKTIFLFYMLLFPGQTWDKHSPFKMGKKHWNREEKGVAIKLRKVGTHLKIIKSSIIAVNRQSPANMPCVIPKGPWLNPCPEGWKMWWNRKETVPSTKVLVYLLLKYV